MEISNAIYAEAYELKIGGFRGVATDRRTGEVRKGEVRETIEQARHDAHSFALAFLASTPYQPGTYRNRPNRWRMNFWLREGSNAAQ
jgi:hypothetical protein